MRWGGSERRRRSPFNPLETHLLKAVLRRWGITIISGRWDSKMASRAQRLFLKISGFKVLREWRMMAERSAMIESNGLLYGMLSSGGGGGAGGGMQVGMATAGAGKGETPSHRLMRVTLERFVETLMEDRLQRRARRRVRERHRLSRLRFYFSALSHWCMLGVRVKRRLAFRNRKVMSYLFEHWTQMVGHDYAVKIHMKNHVQKVTWGILMSDMMGAWRRLAREGRIEREAENLQWRWGKRTTKRINSKVQLVAKGPARSLSFRVKDFTGTSSGGLNSPMALSSASRGELSRANSSSSGSLVGIGGGSGRHSRRSSLGGTSSSPGGALAPILRVLPSRSAHRHSSFREMIKRNRRERNQEAERHGHGVEDIGSSAGDKIEHIAIVMRKHHLMSRALRGWWTTMRLDRLEERVARARDVHDEDRFFREWFTLMIEERIGRRFMLRSAQRNFAVNSLLLLNEANSLIPCPRTRPRSLRLLVDGYLAFWSNLKRERHMKAMCFRFGALLNSSLLCDALAGWFFLTEVGRCRRNVLSRAKLSCFKAWGDVIDGARHVHDLQMSVCKALVTGKAKRGKFHAEESGVSAAAGAAAFARALSLGLTIAEASLQKREAAERAAHAMRAPGTCRSESESPRASSFSRASSSFSRASSSLYVTFAQPDYPDIVVPPRQKEISATPVAHAASPFRSSLVTRTQSSECVNGSPLSAWGKTSSDPDLKKSFAAARRTSLES